MVVSMIPKPVPYPKTKVFKLFISYASEDEKIAIAVSNAVQTALGPSAEVFIDSGLRYGLNFQEEIKSRLDETDVLIVIYSASLKPSHSFTGMELGYFIGVMEHSNSLDLPRRIVPIYLDQPPDLLASTEGINIGISRSILGDSLENYEAGLEIDYSNDMVRFLREFQDLADKLREDQGGAKIPRSPEQQDLPAVVRKMQLGIFGHLRATPESLLKPQKQITIRTSDHALEATDGEMPPDSVLTPVGNGNPMSIFGLQNNPMTWEEFKRLTKNRFRDSWFDAISNVVASALQSQLDVDNSQLIVSHDQKHAYRVILTTGTRFFDGTREFNLYFVEYMRRTDFGDRETTIMFKGLELLCRFRFLFLERHSEFSSMSLRLATSAFQEIARQMEKELNLLRRDALEAGLDRANVWSEFVDWDRLQKMSEIWRPLELRLRDSLSRIRNSRPEELEALREPLVEVVRQLETAMRPLNSGIICELTDKFKLHCADQQIPDKIA
jgi:hypothetical protein